MPFSKPFFHPELAIQITEYLSDNSSLQDADYVLKLTKFLHNFNPCFSGADEHTTNVSERIIRLPIFHEITIDQTDTISAYIIDFYYNS